MAHAARPGETRSDAVNSLIEMKDESTRIVQEAEAWEEVEMIVDSGASGTVVGEHMIKAVEAKDVKNGVSYELADGSRVPHMGKKLSRHSPTKVTCATWWQRLRK